VVLVEEQEKKREEEGRGREERRELAGDMGAVTGCWGQQ